MIKPEQMNDKSKPLFNFKPRAAINNTAGEI